MLRILLLWLLMTVPAIAGRLIEYDEMVLRAVAKEQGLNAECTSLLLAIRCVENGPSGTEMGVGSGIRGHSARRLAGHPESLRLQAEWAAGTIQRRYRGDLNAFARRYCPPNWCWWSKTVRQYMKVYRD